MPVLYFLFFIVLCGKVTLEIVLFGIAISAVVSAFMYKLKGKTFKDELIIWKKIGKIIAYMFILVREVFLANIDMINVVIQPKIEIKPCLVFFKAPLKTTKGRVALANSITLTPGTITTSMVGDYYAVHCIDEGFSEGLDSSVFVEKIAEIEE